MCVRCSGNGLVLLLAHCALQSSAHIVAWDVGGGGHFCTQTQAQTLAMRWPELGLWLTVGALSLSLLLLTTVQTTEQPMELY